MRSRILVHSSGFLLNNFELLEEYVTLTHSTIVALQLLKRPSSGTPYYFLPEPVSWLSRHASCGVEHLTIPLKSDHPAIFVTHSFLPSKHMDGHV